MAQETNTPMQAEPTTLSGVDWSSTLRRAPNRKAAYYRYLQSPEWAEKRSAALERGGRRCGSCKAKRRLHIHHLTYERVGAEEPDDLTILCRACHSKVHHKKRRPYKRDHYLEATPAVLAVVQRLEVGQEFTTSQVAAEVPYARNIVGTRLKRLAKAGEVHQLSKRRWRYGPEVITLASLKGMAKGMGAELRVSDDDLDAILDQEAA